MSVCTEAAPCGACGICIIREYAGARAEVTYTLLIPLIDRALAKRAEWMREKAANKVVETLRAECSTSAAPSAIRALPLAPGGDDEG